MTISLKPFKCLLFLVLLFTGGTVLGQKKYDAISFRIDSLSSVGLPKSALQEVDKLEKLARGEHNDAQQVKAVIYRMTFESYLEEDALMAVISRLREDVDAARYPVKPVLQSLLAEMYWKYYQQNQYEFGSRSRLLKPDPDFTRWDLQTIITETGRLYRASLADAGHEQSTPVGVLNGVLEGDSSTRYLRPTLYDLLLHRSFDFFLSDDAALTMPKMPFSLSDPAFFGDNQSFTALPVKTTDTASTAYQSIKLLQQGTAFHLKAGNTEALADLALRRLSFLFENSKADHKDSLYLAALKKAAADFAQKPISADALVMEGQYYQTKDSLVTAYSYFNQASSRFPKSIAGKNGALLMKQLEEKDLSVTLEDIYVPGRPILASLKYSNLTSAHVSIYYLPGAKMKSYLEEEAKSGTDNFGIKYISKLKPIREQTVTWADNKDYRPHTLEFKIDPLEPGNYVLCVQDPVSKDGRLTGVAHFRVSALAYTARRNPDHQAELCVVDRETGRPLRGVTVRASVKKSVYDAQAKGSKWIEIKDEGKTDNDGIFKSAQLEDEYNVEVRLQIKGDTLNNNAEYIIGATVNPVEEHPVDRTILFTDRQIYRPGQTIYFKALQLQTFKGKSKVMPRKALSVAFKDANRKLVSTVELTTNDYGAASGTFIIPQNILNGYINIHAPDGEMNVRVEEYKRPSFQVEFLPVKETYVLNDTVIVKGRVTAFSGYGLSQAKVAYHITRQLNYNEEIYQALAKLNYRHYQRPDEIDADTLISDDQGNYTIRFKALPGDGPKQYLLSYRFAISADVTDGSGETHSGEATVMVGYRKIELNSLVPTQIAAKDSIILQAGIRNLNGQGQKGEIKVKVYALQSPGQVFKKRLWELPDQHIISKADFRKDFPEYAYGNEDATSSWPEARLVEDITVKAVDKPALFVLDKLRGEKSGTYKVVISARGEQGDTASLTKYVDLIAEPSLPSVMDNWVTTVQNTVKPGESAEFLVGTHRQMNVLMERYMGERLISSAWLTLDKGQQNIKVPVSDTDRGLSVQFMTVMDNRLYTSYQRIYITNPDEALKIKFLTFRDKLQPGEKEQWKLQVTDQKGDKATAEMLAGMYDASLDNITPGDKWPVGPYDGGGFSADFFRWDVGNFVGTSQTVAIDNTERNYIPESRDYEQLHLFGYDYYGGYNEGYQTYLEATKLRIANLKHDRELEKRFEANAKKVKDGVVIVGKIIAKEAGLPLLGAKVKLKGTDIVTITNSKGYFKLKAPKNGRIIISQVGFLTKELAIGDYENYTIVMETKKVSLREVVLKNYRMGFERDDLALAYKPRATGAFAQLKAATSAYYSFSSEDSVLVDKFDKNTGEKIVSEMVAVNPTQKAPKEPAVRKNFKETAFFFPQLNTDTAGNVLIDFTIPEALTKWRFKAFAHTKDLKTGYVEGETVTQKQLSISANMPRFMREGDTVTVSARLVNLTADKLNGTVNLQIFNALNMHPMQLMADPTGAQQKFEIAALTNKAVSFRMVIPPNLDAITYRLTADAGTFSDGEENTLPVLPNRMLVTESMPMMIRAGQDRNFNFDKLLNNTSSTLRNKSLTLEYTQNPAWYAVQAIPYMMEFQYECSEQVFSRYYANSLATSLINRMPVIKRVFDQWKSTNSTALLSNLENNQELKYTLMEETPWLRDAENESEQKKRIALLFNLNKMSDEMQLNLDKLQKRQLPGGGFTWFGGEMPDRFITQHIVAGIGQLYHLRIPNDQSGQLRVIADAAVDFMDQKLIEDEAYARLHNKNFSSREIGYAETHAWYARSYYPDKKISGDLKKSFGSYLERAEKQWVTQGIYEQGMIALIMQRNGKPQVASAIIKSLKETAQHSEDMGMYWGKNIQGYFWYQAPVETQCLMVELFTEAGGNEKDVEEMKIWLLRNKQTSNWQTTKATASACYALLMKQEDWLSPDNTSEIKLGGQDLNSLKPDIKADAGTGYIKTNWADGEVKKEMGKVEIKNNGKSISWGALHWQYLEQLDKITPSKTDIQLKREYFILKQTNSGPIATAIDAQHQPNVGDLLKVIVYLKAGRDFEYVQLKDMRPAGTEPVSVLSDYKYQDGLWYYEVTKDVATNFFISYLNKGNYVFEYQLRVAQPGNFSTGIATIQCMYAPEFNAHSDGVRMTFK